MDVAFLGLGRMGAAMAAHVLPAGHGLTVWNRSPGRADALVAGGAREAATVAEAVREADAVVLMLSGPDSVREVLAEVVDAARAGTLVVDSTTIGPAAARAHAAVCATAGLRYVDAPVAGTVGPATQGTLGVFAGASATDFADAEPLLHLWGDPARVRRVGEVGAGSALKVVVNQGIGVLAAGLGEALALGRTLGLERGLLLDVLAAGPYGWLLGQKRAALEAGTFPAQFSLDLLVKDLGLALDAGDDLRVTEAARGVAAEAAAAGRGEEDYVALVDALARGAAGRTAGAGAG